MCYDDNARPPYPEGSGVARGEEIILIASDGNRFAAYAAYPENPGKAQILIYPDVRGLHQFYKELALRFAEVGVTALAIDYFGRTAGLTSRDESFEYMPHVQQLRLQTFFEDVNAGLAHLRTGVGAERATFIVGFCMGGTFSLYSGAQADFGFAGIIPFYAGLSRVFGGARSTALEQADQVKYPVLGLFGGADQGIPVSSVEALDLKLDTTGVDHTIVIYEGAPHSFFDRRATEYADASADAWKRIQGFIASHS